MTLTVPELWSARDALLRSRAAGIRSVTDQNGERLEYKSDSEMAAAIASLDREIAGAATRAPTSIRFITSKGLY